MLPPRGNRRSQPMNAIPTSTIGSKVTSISQMPVCQSTCGTHKALVSKTYRLADVSRLTRGAGRRVKGAALLGNRHRRVSSARTARVLNERTTLIRQAVWLC